MALTQTATLRLPGPSWDEEVVPALRKRLQSESQTLSKRMSAISLSGDEVVVGGTYSAYNGNTSTSTRQPTNTYTSTQYRKNGRDSVDSEYASGSAMAPARHPNTAQRPAPNTTANGSSRSRTYSQPDHVKMNLKVNGSASKPTRIPKPSRAYATYSNGNTPVVPQPNGFVSSSPPPEDYNGAAYFPSSSTSKSLGGLAANRSASGLLNESPPFPPSSSSTSLAYSPDTSMNGYHHDEGEKEAERGGLMDATPSRQSMESEEQPFEHWYRGEVSRNGGVGELRVGRRQEMLDIANYGHMMKQAKLKVSPQWGTSPDRSVQHHSPGAWKKQRRRAGSIGGLTDTERVRESVYFDEDGMEHVSRVLDENPLTDLEDEALQSDVASLASLHRVEHEYLPGVGDISTTRIMTPTPEEEVTTPRMPSEDRSSTPTQAQLSNSQRGQYPPTRIPGPSRARKTSENRSSPPALTVSTSTRSGLNASTSTSSTSKTANVSSMAASGSRSASGQSLAANKKGQSPSTPIGKRRTPVKSLKGKQTPVKLPQKDKRQSVGQYPAVDNEEDLADAIPTWTQPVPKSGNWDEVVLPVVARNKGLDEYYKTANGRPQPKHQEDRLEPAPGTFGIKDWKGRTHKNGGGDEFIPLDEFGVPEREGDQDDRQSDQQHRPQDWPRQDSFNKHEQTVLPVRGDPPPSPPPFAQYVPQKSEVDSGAAQNGVAAGAEDNRRHVERREEEGAGCCKCSIM